MFSQCLNATQHAKRKESEGKQNKCSMNPQYNPPVVALEVCAMERARNASYA